MKITFAVPHSGCSWWRCRQPAKMITKLGLAEVRLTEDEMSEKETQDIFDWADVIVYQSFMGVQAVAIVAKLKELGKTVIGDYDDLSFSLSPFNPAYSTLGLNEVKVKINEKEEYIWQDGKNGFDIKANYFRYRSLQDLLGLYGGVTTTTKFIKNKYSEFSKNIYILPNSIDFSLFRPFPKKENKQVRIGWTASDSHHSEVWMMKRIMRKIFDKYKDTVRFVQLGNITEMSRAFCNDSYERHDFISLDLYPMKQAALNLDIGLCPLEAQDVNGVDFNRAKSQLKWSEYSALRIPSVCSKLEPYECIEDGVTGLLAKDEEEFFNKLCMLIEDTKLRKSIADNAFDKNYEDYNLEKNAILWVEAYEQAREQCQKSSLLVKEVSEKDTPKTLVISDTK